MSAPKSPANFPHLTGIKMYIGDGTDIAFELTTDGRPVQFKAQTGQLGTLIGKILEGAKETQRRRGQAGIEGILSDIATVAGIADANVRVAKTISPSGKSIIGIVTEIGGVPFTGALSPEKALELAEQLRSAAHDQANNTRP